MYVGSRTGCATTLILAAQTTERSNNHSSTIIATPAQEPAMPNRLMHEPSLYLLQHAHNPVDWQAWNADPLAEARAPNKPIFLSIGYAPCHWCHVMERES